MWLPFACEKNSSPSAAKSQPHVLLFFEHTCSTADLSGRKRNTPSTILPNFLLPSADVGFPWLYPTVAYTHPSIPQRKLLRTACVSRVPQPANSTSRLSALPSPSV